MTIDQFNVAKSELDMDLEIGETGIVMIPVEVMAIDKENYTLRKAGKITAEGDFKPESVSSMRKKIGVVEDLEEPMHEDADEE